MTTEQDYFGQFEEVDGGFEVRVSLGVTQNLGDFNSSRIDLAISRRFASGTDERAAFDATYAFTEDHLMDKAHEVFEGLTGKARQQARVRPQPRQ